MRIAQQGGEGMGDEKAGERKGGKAFGRRGPGTGGSALLALRVPWMGKVMPDAIPPRVLTYRHSQDLGIDSSAHHCLPLLPTSSAKILPLPLLVNAGIGLKCMTFCLFLIVIGIYLGFDG